MKTCIKCGSTEFYAKGGCKPCTKAKAKLWYANNTDRARANVAAYSAAHPGKDLADHKARYSENPKKYIALSKVYQIENKSKVYSAHAEWRSKNPEKCKAYQAAYRAENIDVIKAKSAAWAKANPEYTRIRNQNRRARKLENGGVLSKGLAEKLFKLQKGRCTCCGLPLGDNYHLDHVVPLVLGGSNTDDNMQLLRQRCNHQKHAKHPVDFMQERGFLL